MLTNEEDETVCRCFGSFRPAYLKEVHARNDGTDKVYVKDGVNIYKVKGHGNGQKGEAVHGRHGASSAALEELRGWKGPIVTTRWASVKLRRCGSVKKVGRPYK